MRGVNVGGHRRLRPAELAARLQALDVISIGAAGTFVVRRPIGRAALRAALRRSVPHEVELAICSAREWPAITEPWCLAREPRARPSEVAFLSVMMRTVPRTPRCPWQWPPSGRWLARIDAIQQRFVFGRYRRSMKTIGALQAMDQWLGVSVTTRTAWTVHRVNAELQRTGAA